MTDIKRILCPIDFSECSLRALHHATALAQWYGASLTVLHVFTNVPNLELGDAGPDDPDFRRLTKHMQAFAGAMPPGLQLTFVPRCVQDIRAEILDQTEQVDLVVIGSHGRSGVDRLLLGSVTERVVRKSTRPVIVVPPIAASNGGTGLKHGAQPHIICAIDFSAASLEALKYAIGLADRTGGRLTLFHSIEVPPELQESVPLPADFNIDQAHAEAQATCLERLRELVTPAVRQRLHVKTSVAEGVAYRQLLQVATEQAADLIVMGVHGRGAVDLLLFGSNTARVIRAATCPVLIVPGNAANPSTRPIA